MRQDENPFFSISMCHIVTSPPLALCIESCLWYLRFGKTLVAMLVSRWPSMWERAEHFATSSPQLRGCEKNSSWVSRRSLRHGFLFFIFIGASKPTEASRVFHRRTTTENHRDPRDPPASSLATALGALAAFAFAYKRVSIGIKGKSLGYIPWIL